MSPEVSGSSTNIEIPRLLIKMPELRQTLEQRLKLTPQQILQTILLQLTTIDLEERISEEMENNPVLEIKEAEPEIETPKQDREDEVDWETILNSPDDFRTRVRYDKSQEQRQMPLPAKPDPIDHLLNQIRLLEISEKERKIAEELAWNINESGYLDADITLIADRLNESVEDVEKVLKMVQMLDPPGIGARDLQECLTVQLEVQGKNNLAHEIVVHHFDDFANRRFERLTRALGCSQDELNKAMEEICHLNPKPGEGTPTTEAEYIVPDLIVEEVDGEFVISVNDTNLPELQLSPVYINLLNSGNDVEPEVKKFLRKKVESAQWFIQAVQQRQVTMMKVMKAIIELQPEFFNGNITDLKPMVLKDVADKINMDVSTISRVTRGKYVQTPYGIFELKYFFSEGMTTDNGEEISTKTVKEHLKKVIEEEDKRHPLSDDKLAEIMKKKGFPIARRTVAKYREQMKIPVARLRREL